MLLNRVNREPNFVRMLIARTLAGPDALRFATERWGAASEIAQILRSAVGDVGSDETSPGAIGQQFMPQLLEASAFGRVMRRRSVPWNLRMLKFTAGAQAGWVAEKGLIRVSKPALEDFSLTRLKVGVITIVTSEALESPSREVESQLERDLIRACTDALDAAFLDVTSAGVANEQPESITHQGSEFASGGDASTDLQALFAVFGGDLTNSTLVMHPATGAQLALLRDPGGSSSFPNVGALGGEIAGVPVVTSRGCPETQISIIDAIGVAAQAGDVQMAQSNAAAVIMSDDPETDGTPMVSLFQNDLIAVRGTMYANWENHRSNGVVTIVGADYVNS